MKTILFICTGNTCRSPMAKIIFNQQANQSGLINWCADSAGLHTIDNLPISKGSVFALNNIGIIETNNMSQCITKRLLNDVDLLICMTNSHKTQIENILKEIGLTKKVATIKKYADNNNGDIIDPYGGSNAEYIECSIEIKRLVHKIIDKLKQTLEDN